MNKGNRRASAVLAAAALLSVAAWADPGPKTGVTGRDGKPFVPPAFEKTMQACLAKLDAAETLQCEVRITMREVGQARNRARVRRYRVSMAYPDRLAVVSLTPEDDRIRIVCDGTKTLYCVPPSRQYYLMPGPGLHTGLVHASHARDQALHAVLAPLLRTERVAERAPRGRVGSDRIVPMGEVEFGGVACEAFLTWATAELHYFEKGGNGLYRGYQGQRTAWLTAAEANGPQTQWPSIDIITACEVTNLIIDGEVPDSTFSLTPPAGFERLENLQPLLNSGASDARAGSPTPLAGDLPAQASPAEARIRAEALCADGYRDSPVVGQLFQRAADGADTPARMWLARSYARGYFGMPVDRNRATDLGRAAIADVTRQAETGNADAQFLLAGAYMDGLGVAPNPQEAFRLMQAAARQGHVIALYNSGILLREGLGVTRNLPDSTRWLEQAAAKGYGQALMALGQAYQWGAGVAPDRQKAVAYMARGWRTSGDVMLSLRQLAPGWVPHGFGSADLRQTPGVAVLGRTVAELQPALARAGVVPADARPAPEPEQFGTRFHAYRRQGLRFGSHFDRLSEVAFFAAGADGFSGYEGALPLGLKWTDTIESVRQRIRNPEYDGDMEDRDEHTVNAKVDDLDLRVRFSHDQPKRLRSVRVCLGWVSPSMLAPAAGK